MNCSLIFLYKDSDLFDSAEGVDAHYVAQGHGAREVDAGVGVDNEFVLVAGTETASEPTAIEVGEGHVDGVTQQIRTVAVVGQFKPDVGVGIGVAVTQSHVECAAVEYRVVVGERCVDRQEADGVVVGPSVSRKLLPAAVIALPAASGCEKREK